MNNEIFFMRLLPSVFMIIGDALTYHFNLYEGKPVFASLEELSTVEIFILSSLFLASIGRTTAYRGGQLFDYLTDERLIVNCCRKSNNASVEPEEDINSNAIELKV